MNILQATGMAYPTKYGGFEKWMTEICKKAEETGNKVFIAYLQNTGTVEEYSQTVSKYHCELVKLGNDAELERFCQEQDIRIVHFHFDFGWYKPVYRHLYQKGVRLFAHIHCENSLYTDQKWKNHLKTRIRIGIHRIKTWRMGKYFEKIFASSKTVEKQYRKLYFWKPEKLLVLYLGTESVLQETKKHQNAVPVICCTAFHSYIKGVDVLLEALHLLKERECRFSCIEIGGGSSELNGEDTQKLKTLCSQLHLDDVVKWIGVTNEVNRYLEQSDIYCQPSRTEALGLSIAEAMQHGLPVAASNVGGISELVHDGENGFLVPSESPEKLADALEILIRDKEKRIKMGKESERILREMQFSHQQSAENLWRCYGL